MKKNILVFGAIAGVIVSAFMGISMAILSLGSGESSHGNRDIHWL